VVVFTGWRSRAWDQFDFIAVAVDFLDQNRRDLKANARKRPNSLLTCGFRPSLYPGDGANDVALGRH
jgi:hypothetical protein